MSSIDKSFTVEGTDGACVTVRVTLEQPDGAALEVPAGANAVRAKGEVFPLAYVDPPLTRNSFPAGRGTGELGLYTRHYGRWVAVNQYGSSVSISRDGIVLGEPTRGTLYVPDGGAVLSGHDSGRPGSAASFVARLTPGDKIEFVMADVIPHPPTSVGRRIIGEYLMDGTGTVSDLSPACNRLLLAFYQGTDLVEWGGEKPEDTARAVTAWKATDPSGRDVLVSLGGQGGQVILDSVDEGMARIHEDRFPVDGVDFDNEAFGVTPRQALSVTQATRAALGSPKEEFIVQFVPPGGPPVASALASAVACQKDGFRVYFGQQLYETKIDDSDITRATECAVTALGQEAVLIGIMMNDRHGGGWDSTSVERRLTMVVRRWPRIGGVYFWEAHREGTRVAVSKAAEVLSHA